MLRKFIYSSSIQIGSDSHSFLIVHGVYQYFI